MNRRLLPLAALPALLLSTFNVAQPAPAATAAFDAYAASVESRLARQHQSPAAFLAPVANANADDRLRRGELIIENLSPSSDPDGALLRDWRGTAFVPGAHAADFDRLLRDFNNYPRIFNPQVVRAGTLSAEGDHVQSHMRVRQQHVLTVVLDAHYDVTFGRLDTGHGDSFSRSTLISEVDSAGSPSERVLPLAEGHGFLWRLNTYWTWEERDGGLYIQIESLSLTRSVPSGLGWIVRPFVDSVPRESLEFTLRSASTALRR